MLRNFLYRVSVTWRWCFPSNFELVRTWQNGDLHIYVARAFLKCFRGTTDYYSYFVGDIVVDLAENNQEGIAKICWYGVMNLGIIVHCIPLCYFKRIPIGPWTLGRPFKQGERAPGIGPIGLRPGRHVVDAYSHRSVTDVIVGRQTADGFP